MSEQHQGTVLSTCIVQKQTGQQTALSCPGVSSSVAEVAALSMDTVAKLVAAAGAAQARPLLPDLVPPLLESLSTMEACPCVPPRHIRWRCSQAPLSP